MGCKKGYKQSEEHKAKLANAKFKKGNTLHGFKGKAHSDSFKKMQSELKKVSNPMFNPITAKKVGDSRKGELNHTWKGGVSLKKNIRYNSQYRKWRKCVLDRDSHTCTKCGINKEKGYNSYMTAHHIKEFGKFPELRYDLDNGTTLCVPCHSKETSIEMKNNFKGKRICQQV